MSAFASGVGLIPEQNWTRPDLAGLAVRHRPDARLDRLHERRRGRLGLAADLVGRLVRAAARPISPPGATSSCRTVTSSRYVARTQGTTPLTVTSPADGSSVAGSPVTVTGTTAPGNQVYVSATNIGRQLADDDAPRPRPPATARSASTSR